ncbi:MAG: tetratricopeptide repeat protein [Candidatus Helarchaeota archaeon]
MNLCDFNELEASADILYKIGNVYVLLNEFEKAYNMFKQAGEIHFEINDLKNFALDLEKICEIICGDYPNEALKLLNKCARIYEQLYNDLKKGDIFRMIALIYRDLNDLDSALEFHNKALDIFQQLNDKEREARELRSIGEILNDMEDYDDALKYYEKSLNIFQKLNNDFEIAGTYMNFAALYNDRGDKEKAIEYIDKAIKLAENKNLYQIIDKFKRLKEEIIS